MRDEETNTQPEDEQNEQGGSAPCKITINSDTLQELQRAMDKLSNFPEEAPNGFDVSYVELDGKAGDLPVTAVFENDSWSIVLIGETNDSSDDEEQRQDDHEGERQEERQNA